jgi:hypothetical protein
MHQGKIYRTDPRLRTYTGDYPWPLWFPGDGYDGVVDVWTSGGWSSGVTGFVGPWVVDGWVEGDIRLEYNCPDQAKDGRMLSCRFIWEFGPRMTKMKGHVDLFVNNVLQIRNPNPSFPGQVATPQHYFASWNLPATMANFTIQLANVAIDSIPW